ncbi:MAG: Integral membrane protein [uncultured Truepera sp.]|uniref:Integral membrane protein n=1 Tax=uncultured Truepera sp. TaxID=543023 RepID=A0A6J4UZ89_9DEIN|nr:MAG: Integral membrane protein [uncultured Truepera sp.]
MATPFDKHFRLLLTISLAAVVAYTGFALWSGAEEATAAARRVGLGGGALLLSLSLFNYTVRFGRWQLYLSRLGHRVPLGLSLRYYLASFAFTLTPGKLGEGVRSFYLKPHGVPFASSFSALFVERLFDLCATLLFAALGVFYFGRYLPLVAFFVIAVLLILLLLNNAGFRGRLRTVRVERMMGVLDALDDAAVLTRGRLLVVGLLLSLLGWGAEAAAFHITLRLIGLELPLIASLGTYGLAVSIGALSFFPGGLGSTEATMIVLLGLGGVGVADAGAATIILRLTTLWFAVILGVLFALSLRHKGATPVKTEAVANVE